MRKDKAEGDTKYRWGSGVLRKGGINKMYSFAQEQARIPGAVLKKSLDIVAVISFKEKP